MQASLLGLHNGFVLLIDALDLFIEDSAHLSNLVAAQHGVVVQSLDSILNYFGRQVAQTAAAGNASPAADEVGIGGAVAVGDVLFVQPAVATTTEQHALQVVIVEPVARFGLSAVIQQLLGAVECRLIDQSLVHALELLALVLHVAEVVAVPKDPLYLALSQDLGDGFAVARIGSETLFFQMVNKLTNGPIAGGVLLKRQANKRSTLRINNDLRQASPTGTQVTVIVVPNGRDARCAPELGFALHTNGHSLSAVLDLVFSEHGEHAVHKPALGRFVVELLHDRHQPSTSSLDLLGQLDVVNRVSCQAV